jgi:hypothetical protein
VDEIYQRHLREGHPHPLASPAPYPQFRAIFGTPGSLYVISSGCLLVPEAYGGPAGARETQFIRDLGLEVRGQMQLAIWREEHRDDLEAYIAFRMRQARRAVAELRLELRAIRKCSKARNVRLHSRLGVHPLVRLYLACERAVAWSDVEGTIASEHPPIPQCLRVRKLFYALRCAIVKDLDYLPKSLKPTSMVVDNQVVREDGQPFSFAEVWDAASARADCQEFATRYTSMAHAYAADYADGDVVAHAWGAISWRLYR